MQKMNPDRKNSEHIADHDLERYHLGMIVDEIELAPLEEHLLACSDCAERAQATADYIDLIRRVTIVPTIGARAVGYVRAAAVSHTDPRSRLDAQTATIRSVAEAAGIDLVSVFEDAGESANNTRRPGLLALLAAVAAGRITVVIVPDLARLARDTGDLRRLMDSFARRGVSIVSATEPWGV